MFQAMGKLLRDDPTAVTAEMSAWLSNQDSPALWAPFAFSIRGFAYEVMDECELARSDYNEGLNLYDTLAEELGDEIILRMINNVKFMRVRLGALPPPPAISPVESYFEMPSSEVKENIPVPDPAYEATAAPNDETGAYENAGGEGEWEAENFNEKVEEGVGEHFEEGQAEEHFEEGRVEEHFEEGQVEEHFEEGQAEGHIEEGKAEEYVEEEQAEEYVEGQAERQAEQTEEQLEKEVEEQLEGQEGQVKEEVGEQVEGQVEGQAERPEETAYQDQTFENWEDDVIDGQENENEPGEENEVGPGNGVETQITHEDIKNQEGEFGGENISDESTVREEKESLEEVPQDGTFAIEVLNLEAEAGGSLNNEEVPAGQPENADVNQEARPSENLE